jgi:hypothetical protein
MEPGAELKQQILEAIGKVPLTVIQTICDELCSLAADYFGVPANLVTAATVLMN